MSYDIKIGNAEPYIDWDNSGDCEPEASWRVTLRTVAEAPESEDSGKGNTRSPSYTGWVAFVKEVGLYDLFMERWEGLMGAHPGIRKLTRENVAQIEAAAAKWRESHPDAKSCYCHCKECDPYTKTLDVQHDPHASATAVRLDWLTFWVRWALENCEQPAIENT